MFHAGADATVARHLPTWEAHVGAGNIRLLCGADTLPASRYSDDPRSVACGLGGHSGVVAMQRFMQMLKIATEDADDQLILTEYDTVLFRRPRPIGTGIIVAPLQRNDRPDLYTAPYFPPPIFRMTRETAEFIYAHRYLQPLDSEGGYGDRWIAALAMKIGLPIHEDHGAFSAPCDMDRPGAVAHALRVVERGGWAIHGVKTAAQLQNFI